jgi:Na+-driven multidrug efflux pump
LSSYNVRKNQGAFIGFFSDREYYRRLIKVGLPIALQQLIMSSLNMVGVLMIGQLGAAPVAAVGLANQIFFLLSLMLFGITSGSAMFTAQLWGKRDIRNIRKVL